MLATEFNKKPEAVQCAMMLTLLGEEGIRIYNSFKFTDAEKDKVTVLIKKFHDYFTPKKNLTFDRQQLFTRKQLQTETIEQFATALKNLANSCELKEMEDSLLKDLFICGVASSDIKEKLLLEDPKNLEEALKISLTIVYNKERCKKMTNNVTDQLDEPMVNAVHKSS